MIVTNVETGCDGRERRQAQVRAGRNVGCVRQSLVVLTPRCWRQVELTLLRTTVSTSPVTGESTE
jgi:hypothetical protein